MLRLQQYVARKLKQESIGNYSYDTNSQWSICVTVTDDTSVNEIKLWCAQKGYQITDQIVNDDRAANGDDQNLRYHLRIAVLYENTSN